MIAYLPTIYPDELVYSWFCRYYVHSGFLTHKTALQELYCKRSDNPSKEFIGSLNSRAIEKIESLYPLEQLILDHTMCPQYARFIPLEQKKIALHRLGHDACNAHHLFCILPRSEGEQHLRFCPLCTKEDREKYGETYWHRKHQIRNQNIYTKHKCRLVDSSVPAKSEQCYTFQAAEFHTEETPIIFENNPIMMQFADYLEAIFSAPMDFHNDIPVSAALYHGMRRTKYLKPSGRSRYTKSLADDIYEFYRSIGASSVSSIYQIQRTLLRGRYAFSVVCQIAFFLGMSA